MKQIIQDLKNGATILEDVPAPMVKSGQVLIQTTINNSTLIYNDGYYFKVING